MKKPTIFMILCLLPFLSAFTTLVHADLGEYQEIDNFDPFEGFLMGQCVQGDLWGRDPTYSFSSILKNTGGYQCYWKVLEAQVQDAGAGKNYKVKMEFFYNDCCLGVFEVFLFEQEGEYSVTEYGNEFPCVDPDDIACPSEAEDCDPKFEICCLRTNGPVNILKTALWPGESLGTNQFLCSGDYAFGLRGVHYGITGALEVLKKNKDDDHYYTRIWSATGDDGLDVEGHVVEMREDGTLAIIDLDGDAGPRNLREGRNLQEQLDKWTIDTSVPNAHVKMADLTLGEEGKVVRILQCPGDSVALWYVNSDGDEVLW